jgi:predicted RNA binding protein YcfA (HicA-like mRNA interferase family)
VTIPRNLSGKKLIEILERHGYKAIRSSGSHVRLVHDGPPRHSITVLMHRTLMIGTLNAILSSVAKHLNMDKQSILRDSR